jgi:hypothetical protein
MAYYLALSSYLQQLSCVDRFGKPARVLLPMNWRRGKWRMQVEGWSGEGKEIGIHAACIPLSS